MKKEPVYKVLPTDFGLVTKVELENGFVIKVFNDDPYHYARVVKDGWIHEETPPFTPEFDNVVVADLKEKYE